MKSIEQLKTDKTTFSIGQAMSDGWALVSNHLGYYILGGVIAVLIGGTIGIIPFAGGLANNLIISPCFMASAIFITWHISRGHGWADFGDIFKGFSYLLPVFVSTFIQGLLSLALAILVFLNFLPELFEIFKYSQSADMFTRQDQIGNAILDLIRNSKFLVSLLLLMVALLFISVLWAFKIHFIIIYKMQAWPAMEMSRRISRHNLFQLLGFFVLMGIILIISIIPCGIGLLFTLPWLIGATYSAFAQITQCDQPDEINKEMFDFLADKKEE